MRPRLLDLFCGAGGAAMGYYRAGFDVVGVDIEPQPHYPFEFYQGDALTFPLEGFDAVHASPPCQHYSIMKNLPWLKDRETWDSIPPTRARLLTLSVPWVMENVPLSPIDGIFLCGQMFGLRSSQGKPVYRHRLFESNLFMLAPGHPKHHETIVAGSMFNDPDGGNRWTAGHDRVAMGVDWMTEKEANQALPPVYTEYIGQQLIKAIGKVEMA